MVTMFAFFTGMYLGALFYAIKESERSPREKATPRNK